MSKKDYGRMSRILKDGWLALDILSREFYLENT